MISPSSEIETVDEDTDDSDESDNIYEEALNCENDPYKEHIINRITFAEQKRQATYFHQVKQIEIA